MRSPRKPDHKFRRAPCNPDRPLHCDLQALARRGGNNAGGQRIQDFGTACALAIHRRSTRTMLDIIFLATTVVFFAVAWAYVHGCDGLLENQQP